MLWLFVLAISAALATEPPNRPADKTLKGTFETGKVIPLDWAAQSEVACFPGTAFKDFQGKHSFFKFDLKTGKNLHFRVTPPKGVDVNVYALQKWHDGEKGEKEPPAVVRAFRCEAAHYESGSESLLMQGYKTSMPVLLGVASSDPNASGEFVIEVWEEKGREW